MSSSSQAQPPNGRRAKPSAGRPVPLDGEVIPPVLRVIADREPSGTSAPAARSSFALRLSTALLAFALVAVLAGGGAIEFSRWRAGHMRAATGPSPTAIALAQLARDVGDLKSAVGASRQDDSVRALRKSVDGLKAELDGLRASNAAAVSQLAAKLDHAGQGAGSTDVLARLDKLDHDPRMADIASRLDRIEHQVSSATPTGSIPPAPRAGGTQTVVPQTTAAIQPSTSKPPKLAVLDNWIVRDVYSGIALVEGRSGSVREVVPGETLPGAGEVRSIQRRGRNWVVVTSRGIIDTETW